MDPFTQPCTSWNTRAGFSRNGNRPRITGGRSSTRSPGSGDDISNAKRPTGNVSPRRFLAWCGSRRCEMWLEHWIYTIPLRIRSLLHRNRLNAELDEELRDHIDRQIEENLAQGMSPEQARLTALRAFGNPVALGEQTYAMWSWSS